MKPQASRERVIEVATERWLLDGHKEPLPSRFLFGVRGYWPKSMGPTELNDPGVYDDAIGYVHPGEIRFEGANTDPSRWGWNQGVGKPMAVLNTGCWPFRRGPHKGVVPAFRQMTHEEARKLKAPNEGRLSVTRTFGRNDPRNYQEAGYYAINFHPGGLVGTSSEGCQTLPRAIAKDFLQEAWDDTLKAGMDWVWYILVDGPIN